MTLPTKMIKKYNFEKGKNYDAIIFDIFAIIIMTNHFDATHKW